MLAYYEKWGVETNMLRVQLVEEMLTVKVRLKKTEEVAKDEWSEPSSLIQ